MIQVYQVQNDHLALLSEGPASLPSAKEILWYDLVNPAAEEERALEAQLGIDIPTQEEMAGLELSSRLYHENGADVMTILVLTGLDTEAPGITPVTFILKDNILMTVRYAEPKPFRAFVARATRAEPNSAYTSADAILHGLLEAIVDRVAEWLERVGGEIDGLSHDIFRSRAKTSERKTRNLQSIIERIGIKGDCLSLTQESLVSIERLTAYHTAGDTSGGRNMRDRAQRVRLIHRDAEALKAHATFLSDKVTFLLDATLGLITLEQNSIIKIFSVAAVVFLPPTLIASIYGMNFRHMPELEWYVGYPWALGLMVISAILPYLYFKKRGWL